MDKETWSLVISVVGLALGVLAAHAQLKAIAKRALKSGGDKARSWIARMEADADLYSKSPSALIAFLVKEFLSILKFLALAVAVFAVLKSDSFSVPVWGRQSILLAFTIWSGNKLADVSQIVRLTLRKVKTNHASDG